MLRPEQTGGAKHDCVMQRSLVTDDTDVAVAKHTPVQMHAGQSVCESNASAGQLLLQCHQRRECFHTLTAPYASALWCGLRQLYIDGRYAGNATFVAAPETLLRL